MKRQKDGFLLPAFGDKELSRDAHSNDGNELGVAKWHFVDHCVAVSIKAPRSVI